MTDHCINCGCNLAGIQSHALEPEQILTTLQQWVAPQEVSRDNCVCHTCWEVLNASLVAPKEELDRIGSTNSCANCGRSVRRIRNHLLRTDMERENRIRNMIME